MRVPGNPAARVKASLITYLGSDARVVRDVPDKYKASDGPLVLVADDGGPVKWPVKSDNIIRITAMGNGMDLVRGIAGRCMGHVFGLALVKSDGSTLLEGRDPKTGADFCSFTVTAVTRTATV